MARRAPLEGGGRGPAPRRQRSAAARAPLQAPDSAGVLLPADGDAEPGRQGGDLQLQHGRVGPLRPVRRRNAAPLTHLAQFLLPPSLIAYGGALASTHCFDSILGTTGVDRTSGGARGPATAL